MAEQSPLMGLLNSGADVSYRGGLLPFLRRVMPDIGGDDISEFEGPLELATPALAYDPMRNMALTGAMLRGQIPVDEGLLTQTMVDAPLVGGLLSGATGAVPRGAVLGANVFHAGPHRFATEPDFPFGRPRLDKIGTGEGSQAYGYGFYSADSPKVAETYRTSLDNLAQTLDLKNPVDRSVGFLRFRHSKDEIKDQLKKEFGGSPEDLEGWYQAGKSKYKNAGTLYKLDIPDADVAKYLDYDKPLSEQPKSVRDALRPLLMDPSNPDYIPTPIPDNMPGYNIYKVMSETLGGDQAASEALRKAGIPGLKYFDQGSRAGGEGTRNYVTWDQDVLNRSKMLERDGVTLGANKGPTAALPGLLDDVGIETTQRGNVLEITKIETPDNLRGQGLADQRLERLIQQADADGTTLALTPSNAFGANKSRLTKWYKRHGFVPNKGRNKDFATRESMVRPPRNIELGANKGPTAALPGLLEQQYMDESERLLRDSQGLLGATQRRNNQLNALQQFYASGGV